MPYDRADFDYSTDELPLPKGHAATHIGMFLAWIVANGLEGGYHHQNSAAFVDRLRRREMTGRQFFEAACHGRFWENDLNEEGNGFATYYYSDPATAKRGPYFDDYKSVLARGLPSFWHVADTWENQERIADVITQWYEKWKAGHLRKKRWWQFWKRD